VLFPAQSGCIEHIAPKLFVATKHSGDMINSRASHRWRQAVRSAMSNGDELGKGREKQIDALSERGRDDRRRELQRELPTAAEAMSERWVDACGCGSAIGLNAGRKKTRAGRFQPGSCCRGGWCFYCLKLLAL
jgi:hypothetical protein